jgi:hypothetical protein
MLRQEYVSAHVTINRAGLLRATVFSRREPGMPVQLHHRLMRSWWLEPGMDPAAIQEVLTEVYQGDTFE